MVGPDLSHKSDVGGVRLGLGSETAVREAYREMLATVAERAPGASIRGVLVQPMAQEGRDLIVGARFDPDFGHVVLAGMGGIFVEVLGDAALRVAPFGKRHRRGHAPGTARLSAARGSAGAGARPTCPPWWR